MPELDTYLSQDYPVEMRKIGTRFYLTQRDLNLTAQDADVAAAFESLEAQKKALFEHNQAIGTLTALPLPADVKLRRDLTPFFIKAATVAVVGVVLFSVASLSFTYALREPLRKMTQRAAKAVVKNVTDEIHEFANDPQSPERELKIRLAIRAAVPKLKPYMDELKPLFVDKPASR